MICIMPNKIFFFGSPLFSFLLVLGIGFSFYSFLTYQSVDYPGESVAILPAEELKNGTKHPPYNSLPPTSGWYFKRPSRDGIFTNVLSDEQIVYNLKMGKVGIFYNCNYGGESKPPPSFTNPGQLPSLDSEASTSAETQTIAQKEAIFQEVQIQNKMCGTLIADLRKVVNHLGVKNLLLAPYNKLDAKIALTAWGKLDKMRWVDENRITNFVNAYRKK